MRRSWLWSITVPLATLPIACGGGGGDGWEGSVRDSAGIVIVTSTTAAGWDGQPAWTVREDLVIGTAAGDPDYQFGSIAGIDVDDDGVTFRSHLDGATVELTPERSMQVQNQLGADIIIAAKQRNLNRRQQHTPTGALVALALVLMVAGFCIWLFERRQNAAQFGEGSVARGLGDGFWWSAVTMTTVGYGDKAPKTFGGRVVALIWMFVSLIIIASFTASIAASLTANRLAESALSSRAIGELRVDAHHHHVQPAPLETQRLAGRQHEALLDLDHAHDAVLLEVRVQLDALRGGALGGDQAVGSSKVPGSSAPA